MGTHLSLNPGAVHEDVKGGRSLRLINGKQATDQVLSLNTYLNGTLRQGWRARSPIIIQFVALDVAAGVHHLGPTLMSTEGSLLHRCVESGYLRVVASLVIDHLGV